MLGMLLFAHAVSVCCAKRGSAQLSSADEAMLEVNLQTFRQIFREMDLTVLSGDPARTSYRNGVGSAGCTSGPQCGVPVRKNIRF